VRRDSELKALDVSLRRRFRVVETPVRFPDRTLSVAHPASAEDLIDEREFDRDERLPYWAELWPSARVLGEHILRMNGGGRTLLELGCGAGLVTTCASLAGFDVTATDYYEDALTFARVNAWRNGAQPIHTRAVDWRALRAPPERFDVVIASDVLYERPYGPLVAQAIDLFLARRGQAILTDPGRVARDEFLADIRARGFGVSETKIPYRDGTIRQTITLYEMRRG